MSADSKLIPASSQTVGPFFRIGLDYLIDRAAELDAQASGTIAIHGRVLDRDGAPVPDALLEFWSPASAAKTPADPRDATISDGFRRAATDTDGNYSVVIRRPAAHFIEDGRTQAPHLLVLVFARGLLRHLISRVYFGGEPANDSDPVLMGVPAERRHTLVANSDGENAFLWNVILQGVEETVFFAW